MESTWNRKCEDKGTQRRNPHNYTSISDCMKLAPSRLQLPGGREEENFSLASSQADGKLGLRKRGTGGERGRGIKVDAQPKKYSPSSSSSFGVLKFSIQNRRCLPQPRRGISRNSKVWRGGGKVQEYSLRFLISQECDRSVHLKYGISPFQGQGCAKVLQKMPYISDTSKINLVNYRNSRRHFSLGNKY